MAPRRAPGFRQFGADDTGGVDEFLDQIASGGQDYRRLVEGLPVGITFSGTGRSDATLIRLAYAFETARINAHGPLILCDLAGVSDY